MEVGRFIMILEFSCKNFKSIKNEVNFSMLASSDKSLQDNIKEWNKYRVLNAAAIYGANGSGKSSFIYALNFFRALIVNSVNHQPGDKIIDWSHKSALNEPNEYKIQFVTHNNNRYAYGFTLLNNCFINEYLYCFPNGTQKKIFERNNQIIEMGSGYNKNMDASKSTLKENRLFLSCAANFSDLPEINEVFMYFKECLVIYLGRANDWLNYSISTLQNNKLYKKIFLNFMSAIGSNIKDIEAKKDRKVLSKIEPAVIMPEELKSILQNKEVDIIDVKIDHDDFVLKLEEESIGTQKLFAIMCPIIDIILTGKIFICDEIETSLHPNIVTEIIKMFLNQSGTYFSQIIFTTHDENLLDLDLLRRDQIWFTEMDEQKSTNLYSLSELKNVRKDENVAKGYLLGKYGAIPLKNNEKIKALFKGVNVNE